MSTTIDIMRKITEDLSREFPKCPVLVQESPEDTTSLWVQVFCVPVDKEAQVEDFIDQLQEELAPLGEFMLLPMVKDMAITRQYYPEYLPNEPMAAQAGASVDLFKATESTLPKWASVSTSGYSLRESYTVPRQVPVLAAGSNVDEILQPATQRESTVPATSNFALAA